MRKLTLDTEMLRVESFDTTHAQRGEGTVLGHDTVETEWCTGYPDCISRRGQCQTPRDTCYGSCGCTSGCETSTCA